MLQTISQRYRVLRLRGSPAHAALMRARNLTTAIYAYEPFIGAPFSFESDSKTEPAHCRFRWVENVTLLGWRCAGFADDIRQSIRHRGWFADAHQDEVYRGIVYRLPGGRFVCGYADPGNSDCALIANATTQDIDDAARRADQVAERFATRDREYSEARHAVSNAVANRRSARTVVSEALADLRELETCFSPRIRAVIISKFHTAWSGYRADSKALSRILNQASEFGISASEF